MKDLLIWYYLFVSMLVLSFVRCLSVRFCCHRLVFVFVVVGFFFLLGEGVKYKMFDFVATNTIANHYQATDHFHIDVRNTWLKTVSPLLYNMSVIYQRLLKEANFAISRLGT